MKQIDLTQTGGFPMKQKALAYLQEAHFDILKAIIGHFGLANTGSFIIFGCEIIGTNITEGMLYIDGTLCPFAGQVGDFYTKIAKIETTETAAFKNGSNPAVYYDYTAIENSTGVALKFFRRLPKVSDLENVATDWASITGIPNVVVDPAVAPAPSLIDRIIKLEEQNKVFQAGGGMVLWNKPANLIPTNWQEVVNWKGRIPVGVNDLQDALGNFLDPEFAPLPPAISTDIKTPGRIGGAKKYTLQQNNLPNPHGIDLFALKSDGFRTLVQGDANVNQPNLEDQFLVIPANANQPYSVLNPFRTVIFIEYIG